MALKVTWWTALASLSFLATAAPYDSTKSTPLQLSIPESAVGASLGHSNSFASFSFEPAFWYEFFGNASSPNELTLSLIQRIVEHGGQPTIRPGGITMDSMIFNASVGDVVRTTSSTGGIYRTTVGPGYYKSWSNFPTGTKFISTLNLGNNSLETAKGLAVASAQYQPGKIAAFEVGNEPNNFSPSRWDSSSAKYVAQWLDWTGKIDKAVTPVLSQSNVTLPQRRWIGSSSTTDKTSLHLLPKDIIPLGVDSKNQVAEYAIHSYPFSTCDPTRAKLATIANIVNHTELVRYATQEIYPSAKAALDSGNNWIIGEFNSISCSGNPNVSDTFAQALWVIDSAMIYASLNASAIYLHQGATLVFQSNDQVNVPGANGTPGFSTYSWVYPRTTALRGQARALPSFLSQLFLAEVFADAGTQIRSLAKPKGANADYFSAYALYKKGKVQSLVIINAIPYLANSTSDFSISVDLARYGGGTAYVKRLTAPHVDEKDSAKATWAGQSFAQGVAVGSTKVEKVTNGSVSVRGSEVVLVSFDKPALS